jgi:hypothetical protein
VLRDFNGAYVSVGSFAPDRYVTGSHGMSPSDKGRIPSSCEDGREASPKNSLKSTRRHSWSSAKFGGIVHCPYRTGNRTCKTLYGSAARSVFDHAGVSGTYIRGTLQAGGWAGATKEEQP